MTVPPNLTDTAIALNRFGLGARPADLPPADPKAWLLAQFEQYEPKPAAWAHQPNAVVLSGELERQRMQFLQQRKREAEAAPGRQQRMFDPMDNPHRRAQRK